MIKAEKQKKKEDPVQSRLVEQLQELRAEEIFRYRLLIGLERLRDVMERQAQATEDLVKLSKTPSSEEEEDEED